MNKVICNEKSIIFSSLSGEVLATDNKEHAVVSSRHHITGGASIETNIEKRSSFWLRTENGKEKEFHLGSTSISMRPGQRITIVFVEKEGGNSRYIAKVINHATGETTTISSPSEMLLKNLELGASGLVQMAALITPMIIVFYMLKSFFSYTEIGVGGYILIGVASLIVGLPGLYAFLIPFNLIRLKRLSPIYKESLSTYTGSLKET